MIITTTIIITLNIIFRVIIPCLGLLQYYTVWWYVKHTRRAPAQLLSLTQALGLYR